MRYQTPDRNRLGGPEHRSEVDNRQDVDRRSAWFPYLDLTRGLAALLVALGHLRGFVFIDFGKLDHPSFVWAFFYLITGFGHEAVMAFFVLSGFLVGGTVVSRGGLPQWSWSDYAITRMTRLWIVLIPALLLTALWDNLGIAITGSPFYAGKMSLVYGSGPTSDPSGYTIACFLGNLAFLQTIIVPTFGSNGPLWSLANEFWYYALFPLLFCSLATKMPLTIKVGSVVSAFIICYMLPLGIVLYGLIWLLGVAAFTLRRIAVVRVYRNMLLVPSGIILLAALALTRVSILTGFAADFTIGAAVAGMLAPLSEMKLTNSILTKLSRAAAEFSYTLYLVHFPIAAFLGCYILKNQRLTPNLTSATIYMALLAIVVVYAWGVYLIFERNTPSARRAISQLVDQIRSERTRKRTAE
jgi:peptidoglycan/LPS O-acetylase OafA/YrhL